MKLIHAIVAAGVASVMPTALADERVATPQPFTITFSSEITPISHEVSRYPVYAATRNLSGSCEVTFLIDQDGRADAIRVAACSSDAFRAAAKAVVGSMKFAPGAGVAEPVRMQIGWALDQPVIQTAALN